MAGPIYRFLDTVGDGSGNKDASVDGSSTAVRFKYVPEKGERAVINRMIIHYGDTANWSADEFGNLGAALTNGLLIQVLNQNTDNVVVDLLDGIPVKTNSHWSRVCYDVELDSFGSGLDFLKARWTFSKSGRPVALSDENYASVTVQDNLTGLDELTFMLQGYRE